MSQVDLLILVFTFGILTLGYCIWRLIDHALSLLLKKSMDRGNI